MELVLGSAPTKNSFKHLVLVLLTLSETQQRSRIFNFSNNLFAYCRFFIAAGTNMCQCCNQKYVLCMVVIYDLYDEEIFIVWELLALVESCQNLSPASKQPKKSIENIFGYRAFLRVLVGFGLINLKYELFLLFYLT